MRPKKRILLVDGTEERRGEIKFILQIWGYAVIDQAEGEVNFAVNSAEFSGAHSEIRDRIRIGSARKRGPKKSILPAATMVDERRGVA